MHLEGARPSAGAPDGQEPVPCRRRAITAARPFRDVQDLARRARLNRHDLEALAAADALRGLCGNRYQARWQVLGSSLFERERRIVPSWG